MSENLMFPSNVMEHLTFEQVELLYDRYLKREVTKELLTEFDVTIHPSHIITHFPLVDAGDESSHNCTVCDGQIFTRRKNVAEQGVDWGQCYECGHKQRLKDARTIEPCPCAKCTEIREEQSRIRKEEEATRKQRFWWSFQDKYTCSVSEYGHPRDLKPEDAYALNLLIKNGYVSEDGLIGPIRAIQEKSLLFPKLSLFVKFVDRLIENSVLTYAWTDNTKSVIMNQHAHPSDQKEFLDNGCHWMCLEDVDLEITAQTQDEECDCDTLEAIDICGAQGCIKARPMRPSEIIKECEVCVAPPHSLCINSDEALWNAILELQLMQLNEYIDIQQTVLSFTLTTEELPAIKKALCSALKLYSPSRCAYLIQKAMKDAVVFYQSSACRSKTHACRTIPKTIRRLMDKAASEGWLPTSYDRPMSSVISMLAQEYYADVLGYEDALDPAWFVSLPELQKKFSPELQPPKVNYDTEAWFSPKNEVGLTTPLPIQGYVCVQCGVEDSMSLVTVKTERLILSCSSCGTGFRYKLFDAVQPNRGGDTEKNEEVDK